MDYSKTDAKVLIIIDICKKNCKKMQKKCNFLQFKVKTAYVPAKIGEKPIINQSPPNNHPIIDHSSTNHQPITPQQSPNNRPFLNQPSTNHHPTIAQPSHNINAKTNP